jgi:hypothetical protein
MRKKTIDDEEEESIKSPESTESTESIGSSLADARICEGKHWGLRAVLALRELEEV